MRHASRRPFTVEVKSTSRRSATIIPTRSASPIVPPPRADLVSAPAAAAPLPEKRRILPSLIVPEAPEAAPEVAPVAAEPQPRRPRGRPRKPRPVPVEAVAPVAEMAEPPAPEPVVAPQASPDRALPAQVSRRSAKPVLDVARGERWKRRLGRWSR